MTNSTLENDPFLAQIVDAICHRRLSLPVIIALEAARPLAFLGGQLVWFCQPTLALFLPKGSISQVARLLEEPAMVDALIAQLEARSN